MLVFKKDEAVRCVAFLGILLLLFCAVSQKTEQILLQSDRLVPIRNKNIYRIVKEPVNSIDVVVLGDSLSYSAITPMRLWKDHGITSYVCGQSGQNMREAESMLRKALTKQKPKLVILETNMLFRGKLGDLDINDILTGWIDYHIPVFRGHDVWKNLVMKKEYEEENFKGFAFRCQVAPYKNEKNYMEETNKKESIPGINLARLDTIMEMCYETGATLMLLSTPSPVNHNMARHNTLSEMAKEKKIAYLDMNLLQTEMGLDWRVDSLDGGDHLNLSGAEKVTGYLGDHLSEYVSLPDHREDKAYAAWQKESLEYESKAEKHLSSLRGS